MSDLRSRLFALRDSIPSEVVDVDGIGPVTVRGLTAGARDEWEQRIYAAKGKPLRNVRAGLVALCVYDGGKPVFGSADVDAVGELPAAVVDRLYDVAARLSGMGPKDRETAEGNSEAADR